MKRPAAAAALAVVAALALACGRDASAPSESAATQAAKPSILFVTLDTTRADSIGPETDRIATPTLTALAGRGLRFSQAYTTAPETLPAHASMLTGLYPAGHGVHENSRRLGDGIEPLAARLAAAGYATAAFVSGFPLDRRFGLARGFDRYDDDLGAGGVERSAGDTTDRALAFLAESGRGPLLLWVHYYDPHAPYEPPEPFRSRYPDDPYLGEIAYVDRELGRLVAAFQARFANGGAGGGGGGAAILVAGDHGEGRGDHGETLHGNLLYQGVMRVPLILAGAGVPAGERSEPVSTRRVFDTVLAWAGVEGDGGASLLDERPDTVLGEAMKPFLAYGWQPQVMAVSGRFKLIRAGDLELYDVVADPAETRDLAAGDSGTTDTAEREPLARELARAAREYPLPAAAGPTGSTAALPDPADREARERLATLGYVASEIRQPVRADAPSPRTMTHLFADLDLGSGLFVRGAYPQAIPVFERVLARDPNNLMVAVRLAVAHSTLGHSQRALDYFQRAQTIAPDSVDVRHYLAMHYDRSGDWQRAEPLFAGALAEEPDRLPALEGLARIRERQGRLAEAAALLERAIALDNDPAPGLAKLGELRMALGDSEGAVRAFERARDLAGPGFSRDLELGVCYLAMRRLEEARDALDRVPPDHPGYSMALFKRAQVSVLLAEPDRAAHIRAARAHADATTRPLIQSERLFQN